MRHALTTRLLQLLLASAVLIQLLDTQVMGVPRPGRALDGPQTRAFGVHVYAGLSAMVIVARFWVRLTLGLAVPIRAVCSSGSRRIGGRAVGGCPAASAVGAPAV